MSDTKVCGHCKVPKPIDEFSIVNARQAGRRHSWCKSCTRSSCHKYDSTHHKQKNERAKRYNRELKAEAFSAYGNKCSCCGEDKPEFLTIDHINGDGRAHRKSIHNNLWRDLKRQGFPKDKYRLLCWNCICSIGIHGYCPHQHNNCEDNNG